jgi:hypothetical protein
MKNREAIRAWVTKYALTTGILVVDGEVLHYISSSMLYAGRHQNFHGNDWHRTPEEAVARAEEMRMAKIASLRKSIAKMEQLKFVAPGVAT